MKMKRFYMPTLREDPQEAEIASHKLLLRAGMIRRASSGIYSYLPLGYRVVRKIENIVRDGMDRYGAQEILMSALQPKEIWEQSGRWQDFGPEMFRVKDRGEREYCLGPTAEEYFTDLIKGEIKSYKQLPLNIYQIQTKYRDEKRPRFGINRAREFLMKDAYSFDVDEAGMLEAYQIMWDSYVDIFDQLKLDYRICRGDSGAMGGNASHEFIALSDVGEGVIVYSEKTDYAATDEKAEVVYSIEDNRQPLAMETVETPGASTIEEVSNFLGEEAQYCAKALDFLVEGQPVVVFVPGDRQLNEAKLIGYLGVPGHEIQMMDDAAIRNLCGSEPGFTGPIGLKEGVRVIIDKRLTQMKRMVVGANKVDHHIINVQYGRDFEAEVAEDLLMIEEGDLCPDGSVLKFARGIEVGNIFQLGLKYSESMGATFLDEDGKAKHFWMGSYGIGVTRTVTAVVEQNHDDKGIIWPTIVAPYHAIITVANSKNEAQAQLGEELYQALQKAGIEAMLDDRNDRAGVKFNDRDLIGIPYRITVGKRAEEGIVECSTRRDMQNEDKKTEDALDWVISSVRADLA